MAKRMTTQQVLQRLGGDGFLQRLIGQIEAVGQATDETGQPGKVTLTVKTFKPKEGEVGDLYVGFETRLVPTLPAPKARTAGLYVNEFGISSDNPMQEEMDLRAVPQGEPEDREVAVGQPQARRV